MFAYRVFDAVAALRCSGQHVSAFTVAELLSPKGEVSVYSSGGCSWLETREGEWLVKVAIKDCQVDTVVAQRVGTFIERRGGQRKVVPKYHVQGAATEDDK